MGPATMNEKRHIRIRVPVLARVEGEGSLKLEIRDAAIEKLQLSIFEPPRYFEKFLEGRSYNEVIDITARICGICPVAYQMSAAQAIESIFEVDVGPWVTAMRRVFYCGEWIQSHALHIHLLAAPDFLGHEHAISLAQEYPEAVKRGLKLQGLGNDLIKLFGGRSVHPVGARVGGFHHAPDPGAVDSVLEKLHAALLPAAELVNWSAGLPFPEDHQSFTSVALQHPDEYGIYSGRVISSDGLDIAIDEFDQHFVESHQPHSTALFSHLHDRPYLVGPLARVNINHRQLPQTILNNLHDTGISWPGNNMFHSIVARAIETQLAIIEAIRLLEDYALPEQPYVPVQPRAGIGSGCSEAPRGILWHRYELDDRGLVRNARIVPPTSQNQARIEQDLGNALTAFGLDQPAEALRLHAEMVIRNYDPCISCATHFLQLSVSHH